MGITPLDEARIPWLDENENQIGTCLPISAHFLEIGFTELGISTKVVCPEPEGCVVSSEEPRSGCWLIDWYDNVGDEMLTTTDFTITTTIDNGYGIWDAPTIKVTGLKEDK